MSPEQRSSVVASAEVNVSLDLTEEGGSHMEKSKNTDAPWSRADQRLPFLVCVCATVLTLLVSFRACITVETTTRALPQALHVVFVTGC